MSDETITIEKRGEELFVLDVLTGVEHGPFKTEAGAAKRAGQIAEKREWDKAYCTAIEVATGRVNTAVARAKMADRWLELPPELRDVPAADLRIEGGKVRGLTDEERSAIDLAAAKAAKLAQLNEIAIEKAQAAADYLATARAIAEAADLAALEEVPLG